jgi:hypothetical protein
LEAIPDYKDMEEKSNVAALLETMKQLVYITEKGQHPYWVMQAQFRKLALMKQEPNESLEKFDKRFDEQSKVTEKQWGKLIPYKLKDEDEAIQLEERNQFIACLFLGSVDRGRYKAAIDELANAFTLGNNNYPKDIPEMVSMLSNRRGGTTNKQIDELKDGVLTSFHQTNKVCDYCGKPGHFVRKCRQMHKDKKKQYSSLGRAKAIHLLTEVTPTVKGATPDTATRRVGSRKLIARARVDTVVSRSRSDLGVPLHSLAALIRFR